MSKATAIIIGIVVVLAIVLFVMIKKGYLVLKGENKGMPKVSEYLKGYKEFRAARTA